MKHPSEGGLLPHTEHPLTQEEVFERDGVTVEEARRRGELYRFFIKGKNFPSETIKRHTEDLEAVLKPVPDPSGGSWVNTMRESYENSFYLNSSDALDVMQSIPVHGKDVLTAAGSGDFAQIFLSQGAGRIIMCDLSYPAVFWNELKLQCLRTLSFKDYQSCFHLHKQSRPSLMDPRAYEKVRKTLSAHARKFFDTFLDYPHYDDDTLHTPREFSGFCRIRDYDTWKPRREWDFPQTIPFLISEKKYGALQKSARTTPVEIHRRNIHDYLIEHPRLAHDVVYTTNIDAGGFLSTAFLEAGVKRAYLSVKPRSCTIYDDGSAIHLITDLDQLAPEERAKFPEWSKKTLTEYYKHLEGAQEIKSERAMSHIQPGTPLYLDEMKGYVVGYNPDFQFSLIVEMRAEDYTA